MPYWTIRCSSPRSWRFSTLTARPAIDADGKYLRLMFLKFRHRLGYEFVVPRKWAIRSPGGGSAGSRWTAGAAPNDVDEAEHRCGTAAVEGLNEALLAKAARRRCCAPAGFARTPPWSRRMSPTRRIGDCWPRRSSGSVRPAPDHAAGGAVRTRLRDRSRAAGQAGGRDRGETAVRGQGPRDARPVLRVTGELADLAGKPPGTPGSAAQRPPLAAPREGEGGTPGSGGVRDAAAGRRPARLRRAVNDLAVLLEATTGLRLRPVSGAVAPHMGQPGG